MPMFKLRYHTGECYSSLPMVASRPLMQIWSFREMGKPCKGPTTSPVFFRCSSSSLARCSARSTKISVRQLTCMAISPQTLPSQRWEPVSTYKLVCDYCSLVESSGYLN